MSRSNALIVLIAWFSVATGIVGNTLAQQTEVEVVTEKPQRLSHGLGSRKYSPSNQELPYFNKLAVDELKTGGLAGDYDITTRDKRYVGWFGIVREVNEDATRTQTLLTVEHKYFDGLTDTHIQAVSFNGSGDFQAALKGVCLGAGISRAR